MSQPRPSSSRALRSRQAVSYNEDYDDDEVIGNASDDEIDNVVPDLLRTDEENGR